MTDFETQVAETLHRRLDAVRSAPEIPPPVERRAKRGRSLVVSTGVATLLLLLGGSAWVGATTMDTWLDAAHSGSCGYRPAHELVVYLDDEVTGDQKAQLSAYLSAGEGVERVTYVTKKQAFDQFKQRYADEPEFWQNLPKGALPARFDVDMVDDRVETRFVRVLQGLPGVEEVRFGAPGEAEACPD